MPFLSAEIWALRQHFESPKKKDRSGLCNERSRESEPQNHYFLDYNNAELDFLTWMHFFYPKKLLPQNKAACLAKLIKRGESTVRQKTKHLKRINKARWEPNSVEVISLFFFPTRVEYTFEKSKFQGVFLTEGGVWMAKIYSNGIAMRVPGTYKTQKNAQKARVEFLSKELPNGRRNPRRKKINVAGIPRSNLKHKPKITFFQLSVRKKISFVVQQMKRNHVSGISISQM